MNSNPFIPGQQFLTLPMLVAVHGITWSKECRDCLLVKTDEIDNLTRTGLELCKVKLSSDFQYHEEVDYGLSFSFAKNGFSSQCLCESEQCETEEISKPYVMQLNMIIRNLFYIEYVLGAIAIAANFIVTLTITLSRNLHKPSFILICNVALCDMLMGVYSVLIGRFTVYEFIVHDTRYPNMDVFVNHYCSAMGFIFTTSQLVAVATSLLMTIERFLSIVYCMNPGRRLRKRCSVVLCVVFWCCGLLYATLPIVHVGGLKYHGEYQCMLPFVDGDDESDVSLPTLIIAVLLAVMYIISICLYVPIYRYIKNTRASVGVKRKATLAKNIAVMISTNCLLFLAPLTSTLIFVYGTTPFQEFLDINTLKKLQIYFIFLSWLPVVLLSINSCLNPFLCAFRHPLFQQQIRAGFFKITRRALGDSERGPTVRTPTRIALDDLTTTTNGHQELGITNCAVEQ